MSRTTVPNGAWKDLEFTIAKAEEAMRKEGWKTLPGRRELVEKGYCKLSYLICKCYGGISNFRIVLGQNNKRTPDRLWRQQEYAIRQARKVMQEQGWKSLPGANELWNKGYNGLANAITRYQGGFATFRNLLGQENLHGRWKDFDFAKQQAQQAMRIEGWKILPGAPTLLKKGYSSLSSSINKYHGGFAEFRKKLGQENLHGRWKDPGYAEQQAQQAMNKEGWTTLPGQRTLENKGYGDLAHAITTYYEGLPKFRIMLGQNNLHGRWKDPGYAEQQAEQAMKKERWTTLPCARVLEDRGYGNLVSAIDKYHGGIPAFRVLLGQTNKRIPDGLWARQAYAIRQAEKAMQEQGWTKLPGGDVLRGKGYSGLASAIDKYHGAIRSFRALLGQSTNRVPNGLWKQQEYAIEQAYKAMKEQGWTTLPHRKVLDEKGYKSLAGAISRYYGGFPAFRELLAKAQGQPTHKERLESILTAYTRQA